MESSEIDLILPKLCSIHKYQLQNCYCKTCKLNICLLCLQFSHSQHLVDLKFDLINNKQSTNQDKVEIIELYKKYQLEYQKSIHLLKQSTKPISPQYTHSAIQDLEEISNEKLKSNKKSIKITKSKQKSQISQKDDSNIPIKETIQSFEENKKRDSDSKSIIQEINQDSLSLSKSKSIKRKLESNESDKSDESDSIQSIKRFKSSKDKSTSKSSELDSFTKEYEDSSGLSDDQSIEKQLIQQKDRVQIPQTISTDKSPTISLITYQRKKKKETQIKSKQSKEIDQIDRSLLSTDYRSIESEGQSMELQPTFEYKGGKYTFFKTIFQFEEPEAIIQIDNEKLIISDKKKEFLGLFHMNGQLIQTIVDEEMTTAVRDLKIDQNENLICLCERVLIFSRKEYQKLESYEAPDRCESMAIDSKNRIYVVSTYYEQGIHIFNRSKKSPKIFNYEGFKKPRAITINSKDQLIIGDSTGIIRIFDSEKQRNLLKEFKPNPKLTQCLGDCYFRLGIDSFDRILLSSRQDNCFYCFDSNGKQLSIFGKFNITRPKGFFIDSKERLLIVCDSNQAKIIFCRY